MEQGINKKVATLAETIGFGLAVALYWEKLPKDFLTRITFFDELYEICRPKNVPGWLVAKAVEEMEKKATDFWQWNTIFGLIPRDGGPFSSNFERRKNAIFKMETLAGDDFDKLHALAKTAMGSVCCPVGSDFRDVYERTAKKMNGMKMTFDQWYSVFTSWAPGTELNRWAYYHMSTLINEEVPL